MTVAPKPSPNGPRRRAAGSADPRDVAESATAFQPATVHKIDGTAVSIALAAAARGAAFTLLLDGMPLATCEAAGGKILHFALPGCLIAGALDVVAHAEGRSALAAPYDLRAHYDLQVTHFAVEQRRVVGRFSLAVPLDDGLVVDLLEGDAPFARIVARCVGSEGTRRTYAFSVAIPGLLALGTSRELTLRIAGQVQPQRLRFDPAQLGLLGYVDAVEEGRISGWVAHLGEEGPPAGVSLLRDGKVIESVTADRFRADVQQAGFSDGHSAFSFEIAPLCLPLGVAPPTYAVVLKGSETHLVNSPFPAPTTPAVAGYFDGIEGPFVCGWACHVASPDDALVLEAVCEGEVIGTGRATLSRQDVREAGMPTAKCGFRFKLDVPVKAIFDRDVYLRVKDTDLYIAGSPAMIRRNANIELYKHRTQIVPPRTLERLRRFIDHRTGATPISIVMPVYNTPHTMLAEALQSVLSQWSSHWELVCVDDCSTDPDVARIIQTVAKRDKRVRLLRTPRNSGIARATNFGLRAASHDYVAFLDHDDFLEPDAIYQMARAARDTGADFLYSDEAITEEDLDEIVEVRCRPAFSYDYYLSHPYFVHLICLRAELARRIGGWDESLPISADVDFVLRAIEHSERVAHVPSVLYRWRTHTTSTGHSRQADVMATTRASLTRHLERQGLPASVADGLQFNQFRLDWPDDGGEVVVIIPTKDRVDLLRTCIDSVEKTAKGENWRIVVIDHQSTDPRTVKYLARIAARHTVMPYKGVFNYARMNNAAVRRHGGNAPYLLFLNNDIEATEAGWLSRLRSLAGRSEVGAVGPLLLYGDDRVQHAGVLVGFHNAAEHALKFADAYLESGERNPGYNCALNVVRDYSAVTAACLMMRREVFDHIGGFDEAFAVGFNDTDLCLRVRETGLKVLYDGFTWLYHHESATRSESRNLRHPEDDERLRSRWRSYFTQGDAFYNPNLDLETHDHALCPNEACHRARPPRLTLLAPPEPLARRAPARRRARVTA